MTTTSTYPTHEMPDAPIPFEVEDPELGELLVWFSAERPLSKIRKPNRFLKNWLSPDGIYIQNALMSGSSKSEAGRNSPCPCKSGKKFKKCCMNQ